jgi:hypothetical protein
MNELIEGLDHPMSFEKLQKSASSYAHGWKSAV